MTKYLRPVSFSLITLLLAVSISAQEVEVYASSSTGDRLAKKSSLHFKSKPTAETATTIHINEKTRDQKMIGFGASFLEAGMICINSLDPVQQDLLLRSLFDPNQGAGFSAMKTVNGGTDFMSAGPWYTHDDAPGDIELRHFTIQRDLGPNGLIPYIKRAQKYGKFVLEAPMDFPPDWMLYDIKTHRDVDPKYYDVLAHYYVKYVQTYQQHGIFINYLSLFNEPMSYTKISFEEIRDLLKDHVGPLFAKAGVKTQLQLGEAVTRARAGSGYPVVLNDPNARKYITTLPYHGYDFAQLGKPANQKKAPTPENGYDFREFQNIAELHKMYPDLPLWMSEVCYWQLGTPWVKPIPDYDFEDGDFWGHQIMADIRAGASGWTYWNMVLDETGGPELVSSEHNDAPNNKQQPLVIVNRKTKQVSYTGVFYYLAHFSEFVRPGSVRIGNDYDSHDIDSVAFVRGDGVVVVEVMNSSKSQTSIQVRWHDRTFTHLLPPISITTFLWKE